MDVIKHIMVPDSCRTTERNDNSIRLSNILTMSVSDEGYPRNASWALT